MSEEERRERAVSNASAIKAEKEKEFDDKWAVKCAETEAKWHEERLAQEQEEKNRLEQRLRLEKERIVEAKQREEARMSRERLEQEQKMIDTERLRERRRLETESKQRLQAQEIEQIQTSRRSYFHQLAQEQEEKVARDGLSPEQALASHKQALASHMELLGKLQEQGHLRFHLSEIEDAEQHLVPLNPVPTEVTASRFSVPPTVQLRLFIDYLFINSAMSGEVKGEDGSYWDIENMSEIGAFLQGLRGLEQINSSKIIPWGPNSDGCYEYRIKKGSTLLKIKLRKRV